MSQLNTACLDISHENLALAFDQEHISLQRHLMQHELDIVIQVLYPNLMWQYIVVHSKFIEKKKKKSYLFFQEMVLATLFSISKYTK